MCCTASTRRTKELEHTKLYLSLEKLRFEDKLNIVFDIRDDRFLIPMLTLQPLVENAIRHGIRKSKKYDAPREVIAADVERILATLRSIGALDEDERI